MNLQKSNDLHFIIKNNTDTLIAKTKARLQETLVFSLSKLFDTFSKPHHLN